jgi:hypothetical protein
LPHQLKAGEQSLAQEETPRLPVTVEAEAPLLLFRFFLLYSGGELAR